MASDAAGSERGRVLMHHGRHGIPQLRAGRRRRGRGSHHGELDAARWISSGVASVEGSTRRSPAEPAKLRHAARPRSAGAATSWDRAVASAVAKVSSQMRNFLLGSRTSHTRRPAPPYAAVHRVAFGWSPHDRRVLASCGRLRRLFVLVADRAHGRRGRWARAGLTGDSRESNDQSTQMQGDRRRSCRFQNKITPLPVNPNRNEHVLRKEFQNKVTGIMHGNNDDPKKESCSSPNNNLAEPAGSLAPSKRNVLAERRHPRPCPSRRRSPVPSPPATPPVTRRRLSSSPRPRS